MVTIKKYSANEKTKIALEAIKGELTYAQITSKYGVHSTQINRWKQQALQAIELNFNGSQAKAIVNQDELIAQLYQQIGRLTTECDWLKKKSELFR
ncbi:MAG: transposase [Microcystis sp. M122S2]|uniref:transposase n=1 Tax=Microcystis sp. M122S2 TaxID=2771142 RepID=UPI002586A2BA|nr:transposase [Microcystis sp. M122S2]MCA2772387.1 transposase [Microcystis sp. M122S2]